MSSPRSRGLLARARCPGPRPGVVPALAGVARPCHAVGSLASCRPRARGGCSPLGGAARRVPESSPRSRGLLTTPPLVATGSGRPRARGGCSTTSAASSRTAASSPRSRGLLQRRGGAPEGGAVVPALAGVAPGGHQRVEEGQGRPRARGGCSSPYSNWISVWLSSPRSRGLLLPARAGVMDVAVVPALAGGCSPAFYRPAHGTMSSPRSRGLLDVADRADHRRGVVPALAGVAPATPVRTGRTWRRPRARGGCSPTAAVPRPPPTSSPRSRGLLADDGRPARVRRVVPALAGVAPGCRPCPPGTQGRPRARGGCSRTPCPSPGCRASSPRSRGLLEQLVRLLDRGKVVPVLAGGCLDPKALLPLGFGLPWRPQGLLSVSRAVGHV